MKTLLYYPEWNNRWIPYIEKELSRYDLTVFNVPADGKCDFEQLSIATEQNDLLISMWCDGVTAFWAEKYPQKKIITYLRRYEIWETTIMDLIQYENIDAMIFVSDYYRKRFEIMQQHRKIPEKRYVIPNGIDLASFKMRVNHPEKMTKIAMMCSIKNVKNIPFAAQILYLLPERYTIHHIGLPFNSQIAGQMVSYIHNLGLKDRFIFEGSIEPHEVEKWLEDKTFILSTSINEGNPNNVLEAMAVGVKPIIHNWPGATDQFPKSFTFKTAEEAVWMITKDSFSPMDYRKWVEEHYSLRNFEMLHDVIKVVLPFGYFCEFCGFQYISEIEGATPINWKCGACGLYNELEN